MKTFTKTLATLFAVSLAALALSSCKKVQPTELTVASTTATVIKGTAAYQPAGTTSYKTVEDGTLVTITTKIKTGNFIEVLDGKETKKIEETIASVQQVTVMDKMYEANLPIAPGETYEVEVRCEFEASGNMKIKESGNAVSGIVKYKGEKKFDVAYGQVFVANINATANGFEAQSTSDGVGADSGTPKEK